MKKSNWKKLVSLILAFMCGIGFVFGADDVHAAISKPGQVTGISLARTSGTAVKLSWDEVSEAQGYAVFMKTNKGGYQLIKTTKVTKLNKSGLVIGNSYCFKVRAYKKVRGKKVYGEYSDVVKKKMTNYEYLVEAMEPYASSDIRTYEGINSLDLYGNEYYYSISNHELWLHLVGYASYNLKGQYSKIEFSYCSFHEEDEGKAVIYADDEMVQTITMNPNTLPKKMSIDVEDVYILKLEMEHCALLGVKLYY